jgi:TatD DNase family protein
VIDTHAHLDECADPPDVLLSRAREAGVERVVAVGQGISSCRRTLRIAECHDTVACALGIHPHQADGEEARRVDELTALLRDPRAVAVGEIGLDFHRDYAARDAQRRLLEKQLALADELTLPVVIHTRDAEQATTELLASFGGTVVLHCFSAPALLPVAIDRGYYVSFAGNVTFPRADDLREAAAAVPENRILAETDCPYLAPQPVRGRASEPAHVVHTVAVLAAVRGVRPDELATRIEENAVRAFDLS